MNKQELISKIKSLQDISSDEKAYLIELVNTQKKYGLVWEDKPEDVEEQLRSMLPVFKEIKERAIISENTDAPNHILIEGDNLHALTALSYTHEGKIDVIYIDPPYNTGKENEFRYNDKWILKDDPFKHSTWLAFISKRLKIAKKLLADDGVLICHIDENEFDALNLLLETEVFTTNDFLGVIVWNKLNPKGEVTGVATMHEYVLIYAKNKDQFKNLENILTRSKPNASKILNKAKQLFNKIGKQQIPETIKEVIKPFNYSKELLKDFEVLYDLELVNTEFQAWLSKQDFSGGEKGYKFIDKNGDVFQSVSMAAPDKPETRSHRPLIHPITDKLCPVPEKGWRCTDETMDNYLAKDLVIFGKDEKTQPRRKYLLKENMYEVTPSIYNNGSSDENLMKDLKLKFPYPKVTSASIYFLNNIHPNPKIILDFFAGSGTTLHATMALNAEDGGNRQCILVTNNENKIAEEVTYERNKRVIQGYTNAKGEQVEGLVNNNLRYFQADFVPSERTEINRRLLTARSTELLCIKEDCFLDVTKDYNIKERQAKLFTNGLGKYMIVIYHSRNQEEVIAQLTELIQNLETTEKIKLYAFSPEKESIEEDFFAVADKIAAVPLPDSIYNAYRATFRTLKLNNKPAAVNSLNQDI
jgi:adenine-specific DNA-methyltransferase